jgi:hypothetical protein
MALGRQESLPKGNISGIAEELLYQPTIQKIQGQRRLYGKLIRCLCLWLLVIADQASLDDTEIRLHWDNLLPKDDQAAAQLVLAMSQVGVSKHAICDVLGLDYEEELEYRQDEAKEALRAAMQGQAMPPPMPAVAPAGLPTVGVPQPAAPAGQPPAQSPAPNVPPVNHPAAVAARAGMKAMGAAMKGGTQ